MKNLKSYLYKALVIILIASCKTNKNITPRFSTSTINAEYIDKNMSPSQDFFLYANGLWIEQNTIPPSESRWGSFNELDQNNKIKLERLLDSLAILKSEKGSSAQIIGDYYTSFLDMKTRNEEGLAPIKDFIETIENLKEKEQLVDIITQHHTIGVNSLFGFGVGQDLKNVDNHILYFGQGGIGLPNRDYYMDEKKQEILAKYQEHMKSCFSFIQNEERSSENSSQLVLEFETAMAQAMLSPAEQRIPEKIYNKKSNLETSNMLKNLDWPKYVDMRGIEPFDTLIMSNPAFVLTIDSLLAHAPLDQWKDYLKWNVMRSFFPHLNEKCTELHFSFYGQDLSGKKEQKSLKHQVIEELTGSYISEILGRVFVEKYFSKQAKDKVNTMVDNLMVVFKERIENLDWMSKETKIEALKKLNSIDRKLGFPDKWKDFSTLPIQSNSYMNNILAINKTEIKENIEKLNKPVDKDEWGMPAHLVNAYYNPLNNEIAFPAGIMQAPFFDENAEDAVNYGRIGMVIGHEFTHGFDDMGSKFAYDGTFKNWWSTDDREKFESKTKILGETFSNFCISEGNCINADLTMGENIADLGGLTMAYHAYKMTDEFKAGIERERLTPAQRFFVAYAQLWKIKYTEEELLKRLATDPHSPGMYRVNGPLKNCPEFFEAFNIKKGSKMRNSEEKISRIW